MSSVDIKVQIKNIKLVESSIPMGPSLSKFCSIWKDSFTDGELFIFSRLKTDCEQEFRSICSQINNFLPIESNFLDHLFQNETLAHTSLRKLGIHQNIRTQSKINKVPSLSLEGYFAHASQYSGQYWSKELPSILEAQELGQSLFKELYQDRYEDLTCFFSSQSWTEAYVNPQVFVNFIIFDKKNSQIDFILGLSQY